MEALKFFRNIIIVVVAFFLVMFIYSHTMKKPSPVVNVETPQPEQKSLALTSEKGVIIYVDNPKTGIPVGNPLKISGRAPGNWFFEATAPVVLTDWDGLIIGNGYIKAEGEWMTTDYVPFSGEINYTLPTMGQNGYLILKKDNASGEPAHDDSVQMTISF